MSIPVSPRQQYERLNELMELYQTQTRKGLNYIKLKQENANSVFYL